MKVCGLAVLTAYFMGRNRWICSINDMLYYRGQLTCTFFLKECLHFRGIGVCCWYRLGLPDPTSARSTDKPERWLRQQLLCKHARACWPRVCVQVKLNSNSFSWFNTWTDYMRGMMEKMWCTNTFISFLWSRNQSKGLIN